jgi:hypothetical protein
MDQTMGTVVNDIDFFFNMEQGHSLPVAQFPGFMITPSFLSSSILFRNQRFGI